MRQRNLFCVLLLLLFFILLFQSSILVQGQEAEKEVTNVDTLKVRPEQPSMSKRIAGLFTRYYSFAMAIIYLLLAGAAVLLVVLLVKNFGTLYLKKARFFDEDLKRIAADSGMVWEKYVAEIKERRYGKDKKGRLPGKLDILTESLYAAAVQCEDRKSYQRYYDLAAFRIDKRMDRTADVGPFYTLATAGPAIGFLGTLVGMTAILGGNPGVDPDYFSEGLLYAIHTSIFGLAILVLSMGLALWFGSRKEKIRTEMTQIARDIAEQVTQETTISGSVSKGD